MSSAHEVEADRVTVRAARLRPEVLKECVPGAQEVAGTPEAKKKGWLKRLIS